MRGLRRLPLLLICFRPSFLRVGYEESVVRRRDCMQHVTNSIYRYFNSYNENKRI